MSELEPALPPRKKPVTFKSKKQIREQWAKLDLPDLQGSHEPSAEQTALKELYQDDIQGLGNE